MNVWEWRKWVEEWEWGRWLERAEREVYEKWVGEDYMTWEEWENSWERSEWLELMGNDDSDLRAEWNEWRCGGSQSYNYCEYNIGGYGHIVYDEESLERLVKDIEEKEDEGEYMNVFQWRHWVEEWEWMRWMEWAEWAEWEERNNRPGAEFMTWEDWVVSQEYMDWAEYALDRDDSDLRSEWTTWLGGGCQSYCYEGALIGGYTFIIYDEGEVERLVNDFS